MERLMQFVWQHRLWDNTPMTTCADNLPVKIISPGTLNSDAGPDFFNASININGQRWIGNIEIHVRASDWYRHGHDNDRAYDSVILHVVNIDDAQVKRPDGSVIPQITVKCTPQGARRCNELMRQAESQLPCASTLRSLPPVLKTEWLTALAIDRMYNKSHRILDLVAESKGDWEEAAYITLARALGFGLNSEPFEILAKNIPLRFLNRHRDELDIVEALLFGQAALIPEPALIEDSYITRLRENYRFMCKKFSLQKPVLQWKMAKTRPQNFPFRRLAVLAEKIHTGFRLVGLIDASTQAFRNNQETLLRQTRETYDTVEEPQLPLLPSLDKLRQELDIRLTGFWATHFTFSSSAGATPRALNAASIDKLTINVVLPLMMARAIANNDVEIINLLPELLCSIPAESNRHTRLLEQSGIKCLSAFDSQAAIELRQNYCEKSKCIFCRFGHRMLSSEIQK